MNAAQIKYRASDKGKATVAAWEKRHPGYRYAPHREAVRARFRKRRREMLNKIKTDAGCADCGYNTYPEALDFDHLPGFEKRASVGILWSGKLETLLAEIAKCEVVCANCHRHRTVLRTGESRASLA